MSAASSPPPPSTMRAPFRARNKVGLALAALLAVNDVAGLVTYQASAGEVGPPLGVLILDAVLGVVTLVFVVVGWRTRNRGAVRIAAGSRILSALTVVPAFFAGPPPAIVAFGALMVLVTVVAVALMLAPAPTTTRLRDRAAGTEVAS